MLQLIPMALRVILAGAGIGAGILGLKTLNNIGEEKLFNNGVCPKCSGHFKLKAEVEGSRAYKCDFCSNSVLLTNSSIVDKEYVYKPSAISKK